MSIFMSRQETNMRANICRGRQPDGVDRYPAERLELTGLRGHLQRSLACSAVWLTLVVIALSPAQSFAAEEHVPRYSRRADLYADRPRPRYPGHVRRSPSLYAAMPSTG